MAPKIRWNNAGFRKLLKDPKLTGLMQSEGAKMAADAGPGFKAARSFKRTRRPRVGVYTDTDEARKAEAEGRALTRALGRAAFGRRRK
jgi:hypothetical protein